MGFIKNDANGDPIDVIQVVGFGSVEDAYEYAQGGFRDKKKSKFAQALHRGQQLTMDGDYWVVFWYITTDTREVLLSITQCFHDVPLVIKSTGVQWLLTADF